MHKWKLCVSTYGRKEPMILQMLDKDPELVIHFFVRGEDYDNGFYDELKKRERVEVHSLGYGLHELGLSRHRIMCWCLQNKVEFCCMFDDGIVDVNDAQYPDDTISQIFDTIVDIMENDRMKDDVVGFTLHKRIGHYIDGSTIVCDQSKLSNANYFISFPAQAVVLNVFKAFERGVTYKSLDDVGFEDCAFFADAVKAKLVYCSRKAITIDGIVPNAKKVGGSHTATENLQHKYDVQNARCMKYIGNMMGVSIEQRYRSYANCCLAYIIWDADFFREVLCDKPEQNKEIIDRKFMREY